MAWTTFGSTPNPTGQELDNNLGGLGRMGSYPCSTSGTANAITLALIEAFPPPLNAYQGFQEFSFAAALTNTGPTTIKVGSLSALNVYKDTAAGPVVLAGGEIVQNCGYIAMFDLALNSGNGGFHIRPSGVVTNSPINPSTIQIGGTASLSSLTAFLTNQYTVAFTVVPANSSQDATVALTGAQIGDMILLGMPTSVISGILLNARVLATGSVGIRAGNITAASIAAFSVTPLRVSALRAVT